MSSDAVLNPLPLTETKSAKKKKAKAEASIKTIEAPAPTDAETAPTNGDPETVNGADGSSYESPYLKELYKNIRNIKKKLNATQKVDSIIAENPGKSLDELLSSRKINQDQKAQAQKKPSLQASLAQLEEQIAQYKQFDEDYQKRLTAEKAALESSHKGELEKVKDVATAEAQAESQKEIKDNLLVLSKFLRAAAAKRQGGDESSAENRAFEGALLLVYGGEAGAVVAMEKLISGSDEKVPTVDQEPSEYTYKQVKELSFEFAPYAAEEAWAEEVAQAEPTPPATEETPAPLQSDPTVLHAGLTEIDDQTGQVPAEISSHVDTPAVPEASSIDAGAANAAGEANWKPEMSASGESGPDGWVDVTEIPRDPVETDNGVTATPAAMTGTQSWAEDFPTEPEQATTPLANGGDGFHEVHHGRGRGRGGAPGEFRSGNRGRGGFRGGRGGPRGDRGGEGGYRGDRGGRGRGGYRGSRGRGDGS